MFFYFQAAGEPLLHILLHGAVNAAPFHLGVAVDVGVDDVFLAEQEPDAEQSHCNSHNYGDKYQFFEHFFVHSPQNLQFAAFIPSAKIYFYLIVWLKLSVIYS